MEVAVALVLALLLIKNTGLNQFFRTIFILPLGIPTVVAATNMSYIFSTNGWFNKVLRDLHIIATPVMWTEGGFTSLFMVILSDMWKVTPLVMLILMAGLSNIDEDLYRAARIDRANTWQIFRNITLPLVMPAITMAVIIRGIDAFRIFGLPLVLMGHNLKVLGTYAYLEYAEYNNVHLSAASSTILLFMILLSLTFYIRIVGRKAVES